MIRFSDIRKSFGKVQALDGVSIEINEGEIFGIAGPNGAGKTTLVRILCTALRPDSGSVEVRGLNTRDHEVAVKKMIGYLPEEPNLYERLTARKLLDFFAELYQVENRRSRVDEVLGLMNLSNKADTRISTFSKGMRHRLSLARALLHDPPILVLDEPTMGLDPSVAAQIREMVLHMRGDKTVLLCTHYMEEAEKLCDRMAILNNGRVSVLGSPEELREGAAKEFGHDASLDEAFIHYTR